MELVRLMHNLIVLQTAIAISSDNKFVVLTSQSLYGALRKTD
jgi:hypothetical protein